MRIESENLVLPLMAAMLLGASGFAIAQSTERIPVHCAVPGQLTEADTTDPFSCEYSDLSQSFTNVPAGMYLHVTDVLITPRTFPAGGHYVAFVHQRSSANAYLNSRAFSRSEPDMLNMSSVTPLLIGGPGDYFSGELINFGGSTQPNIDFDIIGFLASEPQARSKDALQ